MKISATEIEERLRNELGLRVEVNEAADGLLVSGLVPSADDRDITLDFVRSLAEGAPIADTLDVGGDGRDASIDEPGDFTDQETLSNPDAASGPSNSLDDVVDEGDAVYVPPTDPVGTNREVLNGFAASSLEGLDEGGESRSDEELADAVRESLRLDSLTTGLPIEVTVRGQLVEVTGVVEDISDAEYIEGLVSAIPGVRAVDESLTIAGIVRTESEHQPGAS